MWIQVQRFEQGLTKVIEVFSNQCSIDHRSNVASIYYLIAVDSIGNHDCSHGDMCLDQSSYDINSGFYRRTVPSSKLESQV